MVLDGTAVVLLTTTANVITISIAVYTLYRKVTEMFENKVREIVRDEINKYIKK
ncbi:MAG: hypothetical protein QXP36_08710 [Conexivisphaerales archaeon]|uniref:hypothetical protein n=1 Tax=Saccharolobus sp. TaxID=2100761 RepID=UPI00317919A9